MFSVRKPTLEQKLHLNIRHWLRFCTCYRTYVTCISSASQFRTHHRIHYANIRLIAVFQTNGVKKRGNFIVAKHPPFSTRKILLHNSQNSHEMHQMEI